ncbi:UNVERIFIED_CONTAM: hypothetical protein PYX00_004615 [Menopon gallinae]|uniref:Uncharacterized protein n=1 Tax=Menopon gallinae TaxID=328185 RepID=A0AAW2I603_9NEOP
MQNRGDRPPFPSFLGRFLLTFLLRTPYKGFLMDQDSSAAFYVTVKKKEESLCPQCLGKEDSPKQVSEEETEALRKKLGKSLEYRKSGQCWRASSWSP